MSFSQISTDPAGVQQASVEDIVWGIDMSNYLSPGESVTNAVATLTNMRSKTVVILQDSCAVLGNVVTQRIRSTTLLANITYQLLVTFTAFPTSNELATVLSITCPL